MNKKKIKGKTPALVFSIMMALVIISAVPIEAATYEKTFTNDTDFDIGILVGVEHDTVHDQLQLSQEQTTLPFIWVPNSEEGTVSKVDTRTGKELGRYLTGPTLGGSPSRTTVDLNGNVWFGNRNTGTVVKIGLYENGQCKDKNGNGIIETSTDLNNDGNVVGGEILPWGSDECVLYEVVGIPGVRGIAVDKDNNLWAGSYGSYFYKFINGETGAVMAHIPTAYNAYGAVFDSKGILWSSEWQTPFVGKLDPATLTYTRNNVPQTGNVYGMGIDRNENLLLTSYQLSLVSKFNISSGVPVWVWTTYDPDLYLARGVVATSDGDIWVAASGTNKVIRLSNDGVIKARIVVGAYPTGVSVDNEGKIWVVNYNDGFIKRINPATNTIDLEKLILGNAGIGITHHYGYSDMTGFVARTITTKVGTWTVIFDSGSAGTPWGTISWNSAESGVATVKVRARSSDDSVIWSPWYNVVNNVELTEVPNGRYLQKETTFQIISGDVSSILFDLSVKAKATNQPPTPVTGGPYVIIEGSSVLLDASGSIDPDEGNTLTYEWDLNNDGNYETPGVTATLTLPDGPAIVTVGLKVTDNEGAFSTTTTTITVNNAVPTVSIDPVAPVDEGSSFSSFGSFADLGINDDVWTGTVNYGDGEEPLILNIDKTFSISHSYADNGVYPVVVEITDKNGATGTATIDVTVNNVAPVVGPVSVPIDPQQINTAVTISSLFTDVGTLDTHTVELNFGDGTISTGTVSELGGSGTVSGSHVYTATGIYTIKITVTDKDGGVSSTTAIEFVVIYNPDGGFVTGGAWYISPPGAYLADPASTGKANIGFVSKYQKGSDIPTGTTEFQFHAGNLNFHSLSYNQGSLVVAGQKAIYKGIGQINGGAEQYKFMVSAIDNGASGDTFRIKITDMSDVLVYDNQVSGSTSDDAYPEITISGGNIVIHKGR